MAITSYAQDLYIDQGSTFSQTIIAKDANRNVVDITGATCAAQGRHSSISPAAAITFTCTLGNPLKGQVILSLTYDQTRLIKAGEYLFDLEVTIGAGRYEICEGIVYMDAEMTKIPDSSSSESSSSSSSSST